MDSSFEPKRLRMIMKSYGCDDRDEKDNNDNNDDVRTPMCYNVPTNKCAGVL